MELENILINIFNDSQDVTFDIQKGIENLREIFGKVALLEHKERCNLVLLRQFVKILQIILVERNEHRIHFVIEFLANFLAQFNQNENELYVQYELINYLIHILKASSDTVRQRTCFILYKLLESSDEKLNQSLFLKLQLNLVERLRDSNKKTQIFAIKAAAFLQIPHDKYCPIINSFLDLLKKESLPQIRTLLIESIAINDYVFNVFKHCLLYDTNISVQNKVLAVLEKKAENDYFDPEFKRQIVNCLLRSKSFNVLEKYIQKWSNQETTYQFLMGFDIKEMYLSLSYSQMEYIDEKLEKIMELFYSQNSAFRNIIDFNQTYRNEDLFKNLELSIQFRFLLKHCLDNDKGAILTQHLAVDLKTFRKMLMNSLKEIDTKHTSFILYNLIEAFSHLNMLHLDTIEYEPFMEMINIVESGNEHNEILIKLVVEKICSNRLPGFVCEFYKSYLQLINTDPDLLQKILCILICFTARLTEDDFKAMDSVSSMNFEDRENTSGKDMNLIEYLLHRVVLTNISHLDPYIRALAVKELGLACLISSEFAACYTSLLLKILALDYPQVIKETQKSLFNITLTYSRYMAQFDEDFGHTLKAVFDNLETHLDLEGISDIQFIAYEGFAKLLVNGAKIPNKSIILLKLLTKYFSELGDEVSNEEFEFDKKLKSLLCTFFDAYTSVNTENLNDLSEMALPMLKISIEEPQLKMRIRKVAKFFYYYTYGTTNRRQVIISSILNQIRINYNDYKKAVIWIEIMLEFNVHQSDIRSERVKYSVALLNEILVKLEDLIMKFKKEKWKLTSEVNVRNLMDTIKRLIANNGGRLVSKRKLDSIHQSKEESSNIKKKKAMPVNNELLSEL